VIRARPGSRRATSTRTWSRSAAGRWRRPCRLHIDSDTGEITTLDGQPYQLASMITSKMNQPGAPFLMVMSLGTLDIPAGVTVRIDGTAAFAFAVRDQVSIAGTIDVSAQGALPGAGGFAGATAPHRDGLGAGAGRRARRARSGAAAAAAATVAPGGAGGGTQAQTVAGRRRCGER